MATLSISSDNAIELRNLKNTLTNEVITTATVTVTLTQNGSQVSGEVWPLAMPHIANGLYRAVLTDSLVLDTNLSYLATVVADNGAGQRKQWCVPYSVVCDE